jgi:large-conductance mechanosensitive channel
MSGLTTMNHLVDNSIINRIQVNLAESRQIRMGYGAFWFNTIIFLGVVGISLLFMVSQYHSSKQVLQPVKNIPKTELIWNNSIRNSIEL